eukprot:215645-Amphidinium_carterae.1
MAPWQIDTVALALASSLSVAQVAQLALALALASSLSVLALALASSLSVDQQRTFSMLYFGYVWIWLLDPPFLPEQQLSHGFQSGTYFSPHRALHDSPHLVCVTRIQERPPRASSLQPSSLCYTCSGAPPSIIFSATI